MHLSGDSARARRLCSSQSGQAAVELVAVLPLVGLAAVLCFHLAIAGWALWSAAEAARAGARAVAVDSKARRVALAALPAALRDHATVDFSSGRATVSIAAPTLLPGVSLPRLGAEAGPLEPHA